MNSIARFAVNNPVTVLMLVLGIVLLGFISFGKLGTDLFPDLNTPKIYIEIKAGEKPPEEIEKNYVDQIESLSMRQSDVVQVSSVSRVGSAIVTVEYDWNKDMDEAFLDLQKEMNSFSQNSDLDDFTISQYDPNASPVMTVALKRPGTENMEDLRKVAENYIRNELVRIEGVADVKLTGIEESEVVIETNKYVLESFGLTSDGIAAQIANYNRNVSGGSLVDMGLKYVIKGVSLLENIEDLKNIIVGFRQQGSDDASSAASAAGGTTAASAAGASASERVPVYLRDIATVGFANKDPENIVTLNGERCIGLLIYKEPEYNTVDAVKSLETAVSELEKSLPGYQFIKVQDQGAFIDNAIGEVKNTLIMGIILAVIILYVFLRRIGTTLVISIAIPVSIIATFNLMYFNDLTLNIMTLGGLALGAGMLVDNAIVVLENITRLREGGMPLKEAVIQGTGEVGGAITASTVTTIVVFLPIVYLHGASGEMFRDQAWTVAFSLLASLVIAMLVIPMLVSTLFTGKKQNRKITHSVSLRWYEPVIRSVVERRGLVIFLAALLLAGAVLAIPMLGSEFMPKSESAEFTLNLTLPEGTSLERTRSTAEKTEDIVRGLLGEKIDMIYSMSGSDNNSTVDQGGAIRGENTAQLRILLKKEFATITEEAISLIGTYLKTIPDIDLNFSREETSLQSTLGNSGAPFALEISGEDYAELEKLVNEAKAILSENKDLYNISTSLDEGTPEVEVAIDRFKSSYYNVTSESVISQVKSYLTGSSAGSFEKDGEMKDITIKLGDISLGQLRDLMISAGSVKVPLSELAAVRTLVSPREITRRNQARTSYVYAMVGSDAAFDKVIRNSQEALKAVTLPVDYKMEFTGEELRRKESMSNLSFALILSLVLVFMVLAAQFESVIQPFIIMLTIPFAGVGTVITFLITGETLNMMAYIGIIMLGGIAVNNAILLIDRINQLREEGIDKKEAIIRAGMQRIRPILMTSLTTILALLPLTLGIGESASLRAPMALAVVGGLVSSSVLTLVVIPCVYWVFDSFSAWLRGNPKADA
ncbi:MAG: efflux RND transporter permease subunit [Bacteroidales bacterium]|jgi:HAE1 family hydrophobic/amphiphilic exporter-1|nr:efflux RND transporter permease subunit [Bacteroidales bacterium]